MNIYLQNTGKKHQKYLNSTTVFQETTLYLSDYRRGLKDSQ